MNTATTLKYNIAVKDGEATSVTFYTSKMDIMVAQPGHPRFAEIMKALVDGERSEQEIIEMFTVKAALDRKFLRVGDRVMISGSRVLFDGEAVDDALTKAIIRFNADGNEDFMPLIYFMEKVRTNPQPHSRDNLFDWMQKNKFGLTEEGDIIAYKGVQIKSGRDEDDYKFQSASSGEAFVNGELFTGKIPTNPGTVVEMPRSAVNHNPSIGCSTGLHAGDWSYASSFATKTLRVSINPRDVVSVPTECSYRKMRVCRYKVLGEVTSEDKNILFVNDRLLDLTRRATTYEPRKSTSVPVPAKKVDQVPALTTELPPLTSNPVKKAAPKASTKKSAADTKAKTTVAEKKTTPTKKAAAKKGTTVSKAAPKRVVGTVKKSENSKSLPDFYEEYTPTLVQSIPFKKKVWLAGEWGLKVTDRSDAGYTAALVAQIKVRRRKAETKASTRVKA